MKPKDIVTSYIRALDSGDYPAARELLADDAPIKGPGEELKPDRFIEMLKGYRSRYDVKKIFEDTDDVCVLYELSTPTATVFMCSWYVVKGGKIASVRSIFDPRAFAPPPAKK
jgi:ketosteroid isomerase-like protein